VIFYDFTKQLIGFEKSFFQISHFKIVIFKLHF
jgi:hypothetical protein